MRWRRRSLATLAGVLVCAAALALALAAALVVAAPSHAASAEPDESAAAIVLATPGEGWRAISLPSLGPGALRAWTREPHSLRIFAVARRPCGTNEPSARSAVVLFLVGVEGVQPVAADGGLERFQATDERFATDAVVFETARFVFTVVVSGPLEQRAAALRELDAATAAQAARDGGIIATSAQTPAPLDEFVLAAPPVPGFVGPLRADLVEPSCPVAETSRVARVLARDSTTRTRMFLGDALVVVDLVDYPYELFAAAAAGTRFTHLRPTSVDGLARPNVRTWMSPKNPNELHVTFRRGRISAMVAVTGADRATSARLVSTFVGAVDARLPRGSTSVYEFPSPLRSVTTASGFVVLLGTVTTVGRRVKVGSIARVVPPRPAPGPGALFVDVGAAARTMRRRGFVLGLVHVASIAVVLVGLAADIGAFRWVLALAGVATAVVSTALFRRAEHRLVGSTDDARSRPRPTAAAVAVAVVAIVVLTSAAALIVRGLQELAFAPSLRHLELSDRLRVAPRALAWLMVAAGVVALVAGAATFRAAKALARVGWRSGPASAPIVYLRSFHDDALALPTVPSARRPFVELFSLRSREPFEESVAWELAVYGPVIAIGRPGGRRASLGAAREHIDDDRWQGVIADMMAKARAIVVTIGATPGLAWELTHITMQRHLDKTTFLVPPVAATDACERWHFTAAALVAAGAAIDMSTLPIDAAIAIQLSPTGACVVHGADRRDEATYRAALDAAVFRQTAAVNRT